MQGRYLISIGSYFYPNLYSLSLSVSFLFGVAIASIHVYCPEKARNLFLSDFFFYGFRNRWVSSQFFSVIVTLCKAALSNTADNFLFALSFPFFFSGEGFQLIAVKGFLCCRMWRNVFCLLLKPLSFYFLPSACCLCCLSTGV